MGEVGRYANAFVGSAVELECSAASRQSLEARPPGGEHAVVEGVQTDEEAVRSGVVPREQPTRKPGRRRKPFAPRWRKGQAACAEQSAQGTRERRLAAERPL